MNYWPAEVAGLPECVEPLTRMVEDLAETGGRVAKMHYGARGWVFHQNTDQWRAAAPMDGSTWGTFSIGGAWLCTHLWEHYLYTGDKEYLRRVYPLLKGSAQFFLDTLVEYPGHQWLVTCPSTSPENFPAWPGNKPFHDKVIDFDLPGTTICAGSTIDMCVLRELFEPCSSPERSWTSTRNSASQVARARRSAGPAAGRQGGQPARVDRGLGRPGAEAPAHFAPLGAVSRPRNLAGDDSQAGAGRQGFARSAGRLRDRFRHGLEGRLLGPPAGRRSR